MLTEVKKISPAKINLYLEVQERQMMGIMNWKA